MKTKTDKRLLINRAYKIIGSWYDPQRKLKSYRSVKKCKLINTTSSAGDWEGMLEQSLNGKSYIIPFSQTNRWPNGRGFTLMTGEVFAEIKTKELNNDVWEDIINQFWNIYYM